MKFRVFWDVAPYSHVELDRRFRGVYCLHHQGDERIMFRIDLPLVLFCLCGLRPPKYIIYLLLYVSDTEHISNYGMILFHNQLLNFEQNSHWSQKLYFSSLDPSVIFFYCPNCVLRRFI
jgi:hypothetical protein